LQAVLFRLYANKDTSYTIRFENGREHGEAISYYLGAKIKDKRFFINGWKQGQHKGWYENGKLAYVYEFKDDEFNGIVKEWSALGILFREMNYVYGHEEGMQTIRYANGKIKSNYFIKNGTRYGLLGTKNCINVSDSIFN
jgi:antitoxin component YwqK of YwqJK toxin-antitoxin module